MLKVPAKSKPPPWIPPGKNALRGRKTEKPKVRNKSRSINDTSIKDPEFSTDVKEDPKEDEPVDDMSVSSSSSLSQYRPNEPNIHVISIYQDMKLLYVHFSSLRTSYIVAFRLMDLQSIEDATVKEMLNDIGVNVKESNTLFDDLEFAVTVLENTLEDGLKTQEYLNVFKCKDRLLSKILDMYERVILVYQFVFEKLDFQEMSSLLDSVTRKLKASEKKNISQEATIKDLERRISIHESKTSSLYSYKANLENAKADLEKQLAQKEVLIKYLNVELVSVSGKKIKSDHEELIQIMKVFKSKTQSEKNILKEALNASEKKNISQEATIKDLERRMSIHEDTIKELQIELDASKKQVINLKAEKREIYSSELAKFSDSDEIYKEIQQLAPLLQSTKDAVERLHECSFIASSCVEHSVDATSSPVSIFMKNKERIKMKYEYQQKKNDLESQLREYKEKVKILEVDHHKMSDLEEELKTTKAELTLVREKIEEETSRLLQFTKELQESLDSNIAEKKLLDRYTEVLKTLFSNVFGGS